MPVHIAATITAKRIAAGRTRAGRAHFPTRPMTRSGWTVVRLKNLRDLHFSFRGDLVETAAALRMDPDRCDQALNALLGRTEVEAFAALEARA